MSSTGSTIYSIYKQVHPPTGIEHCLQCYFYNSDEKNLVVSGVNILKVFKLTPERERSEKEGAVTKSFKMRLQCMQSFALWGNITSMRSIRLANSDRDSILLCFKDAKMSVVEYDPETHDLATLSMHYFEEEEIKNGRLQITQHPIVRVDPDQRCSATLVYGNRIVILPFRKDTVAMAAAATDTLGLEDFLPGLEETESVVKPSLGKSRGIDASYMINTKDLDDRMDHVIDIQFLHGYYEPTLVILYDPLRTWAARVAVRKDTCAIVAISLNVQQKVNPVIWTVNNLPFDCCQALAVPKPIGGVLVLAVNSLLYLNQSVPPYGVSLNSLTENSTAFPLKIQEGVKLSLDCCAVDFISNDKLILSLKGGELYTLALTVDGTRCVRSFLFDKAAASVLTTAVCVLDNGYLFLASRLGNSLLLRYTETVDLDDSNEPPPPKKKKVSDLVDNFTEDIDDELLVYGAENEATAEARRLTSYSLEVLDSLLNVGPCGNVTIGEPAYQSEEFADSIDPDVEILTTSGHSKNGALCVLQRNIRPQVVTTYELPGFTDMWTVFSNPQSDMKKWREKSAHSFLILSRPDSSMILQTSQEINEVDSSGFDTQASTVFACNLGSGQFIVQVTATGLRLLKGIDQLQSIPLELDSPIVHAAVCDPYLMVVTENGQLVLLTIKLEGFGSGPRLTVTHPAISKNEKIVAICAYKDTSGLFTTRLQNASSVAQESRAQSAEQPVSLPTISTISNTMDIDEDELLYGSDSNSQAPASGINTSFQSNDRSKPNVPGVKKVTDTYWAVVARQNGDLQIYDMPEFQLKFKVDNFNLGSDVLQDSTCQPPESVKLNTRGVDVLPRINEILLIGLGYKGGRPHLLARIDADLYIYEAYSYNGDQSDSRLKLRFKKFNHNLLIREKKAASRTRKKAEERPETAEDDPKHNRSILRAFSNVAGYSGVFVCGVYPHWLMMSIRGELRLHPMGVDGTVTCFAPFNNVNCPQGFLYFNQHDELRICVLPMHLNYDAGWPTRKVALRCTPHYVTYHLDSKTYVVVTSTVEPCMRIVKCATAEDKDFDPVERDERFIYPSVEQFSLQLFSPVSWEPIPNTKYEFEEYEHVTCIKLVSLEFEGTVSGRKNYLVIGTTYSYGMDVTSRGRIHILDVIEVVPEPGQPLTKHKLKVIYDKEQKGPVTAISNVQGLLVSSVGQKVYVWQMKNNDLSGIAFIDTDIYIHLMINVKNFIFLADIYKSISVLRFQQQTRTLSLVSHDFRPLEVYAIEFFIDNTQMGFLVSDADKNLILYVYAPESRESVGGMRLLRKADFHVGSHINSMFRIKCKMSLLSAVDRRNLSYQYEYKHVAMLASLDGSLSYMLPLSEKTYRRLLMLQNLLATQLPQYAGLNHRAYRMLKSQRKTLVNNQRNVLDGELLYKFANLSIQERLDFAKRIGTTEQQIYEDLMDIDRITAHF